MDRSLEKRLESRPDVVCRLTGAFSSWMDAVGLVEGGHARHALQEKRDECHALFARKRAVHVAELVGVGLSEVGRRLHAGEHDLDMLRLRAADDLAEIPLEFLDAQAPQAVVSSE